MQAEESRALGKRLLNQQLRAFGATETEIAPERWNKLIKESSAKSRQEILADIGLGKRLAAIVARKLLALSEQQPAEGKAPGSIVIRGSEGMAVQFARCCNPIPGDPIVGFIKKGEGLVVHTHDCPTARKSRGDPEKWIDVEWDPDTDRVFDVNIRTILLDQRGVLAKVAAAIAGAGCNISNVTIESDHSMYATNYFTVQVTNRMHLAKVMRALRRLPEVVRIARVKE